MTNRYTFDMTKLTIQDYVDMVTSASSNNILGFLKVIDKVATVSVFSLPFSEFNVVCSQFTKEVSEYLQSQDDILTPDAMKILSRLYDRDDKP